MKNFNYSGSFKNETATVQVKVGLFQFKEDDTVIVYAPAFDVSGYGQTMNEAFDSFKITLDEFLDYSIKKNTFLKELKRLGWNLKESDVKKRKIKSPELASLILKNDYLAEILNEKQFKKIERTVSIPC